jgi:hypothetical protein
MLQWFSLVLSIYFLNASVANASWIVRSSSGVMMGKKSLRPGQKLPMDMQIQSQGGALSLQQGAEVWDLKFYKNTILKISQEYDQELRGQLISGEIQLRSNKRNTLPFVLIVGDWELRKFYGVVTVEMTTKKRNESFTYSEMTVSNREQSLWLKKYKLDPAQELPAGTQFKIHDETDIFAFAQIAENQATPRPWRLESHFVKTKGQRKVASVTSSRSGTSLCGAPSGQFQQCAWKCFGSRHTKGCDTGQGNTHCVRFTCTADGHWKMPTLVPGGACPLIGSRVDQCQ